ncbi:hypothetical protein EV44_g2941 [Erysiphe necator]|uniref:Uncharacterized protein n=1 Tax=Uncinula necator TaxID=52586 RepID=A0A0B1PFR8_UNCNE|nr:hypothetical protein EV44_g2941 [Erysiphe necator]
MFEIVEEEVLNGPVPEEAPLGDDPIFMLSQILSRGFKNHDEIQRRLQADEDANGYKNPDEVLQVNHPNIDPFLEELPPPEIDNDNQVENLVLNDPFIEENPQIINNEVVQSQSLQQIDPFLESNLPPQAEGPLDRYQFGLRLQRLDARTLLVISAGIDQRWWHTIWGK